MASVSSLDKDLRKLRLEKYTPAAAEEARVWIEGILGSPLPSKDLLEGLKDGVALCKLVNLVVGSPPLVKFKQSAMPFVQMENISHFLRACQSPPINLLAHDVFLTVDLYEQKDPAQVLQCIGAFSRAAHALNPTAFPTPIGPKSRAGLLTPEATGYTTNSLNRELSVSSATSPTFGSRNTLVPARTGGSLSGRRSPRLSPISDKFGSSAVSTWSKKDHEGVTSPAWNIAQYGYMGGASQANLGIAFGGRRQITSASPRVPTLAEKERKRKEEEAEAERQRLQMEEETRRRKAEMEAKERQAQLEEEKRWAEETRRQRAEEKRKTEEEKRRWAEEERQWRLTEENRRREEELAEARLADERMQARNRNDGRLRGQFLSEYQAEQNAVPPKADDNEYSSRVKQLEQELALARQREQEYEEERQKRSPGRARSKPRARSRSGPKKADNRPPSRHDSWRTRDEAGFNREHMNKYFAGKVTMPSPNLPPRPLPDPTAMAAAPVKMHRTGELAPPPVPVATHRTGEARPLPVPGAAATGNLTPGANLPSLPPRPLPVPQERKISNPVPIQEAPRATYSRELDTTAERDAENSRRAQPQTKDRSGSWTGKTLLEREMEMERQRQREWEEAQEETAKAIRSGEGVEGIGGRWDVSQWSGYTGGDSQNKGSAGIGAGRRPIVGPRPPPHRG